MIVERAPANNTVACGHIPRSRFTGLDTRFADKIFGVCQRLHTREEYPGNGVGLALARRIVERHGGEIWVESSPGNGATFHFTLPDPPTGGESS